MGFDRLVAVEKDTLGGTSWENMWNKYLICSEMSVMKGIARYSAEKW